MNLCTRGLARAPSNLKVCMVKNTLSLLSIALIPALAPAVAMAESEPTPPLNYAQQSVASMVKFSLESVKMSSNERMGLLGGNYLLEVQQDLFLGPAVYSSVTGKRGGLYVGGIEASLRKTVSPSLSIEPGMYIGGGGGGSAGVGGGLMLRPHLDLMLRNKGLSFGLSISQVRFPSGHITSNQVGLVASLDETFIYTQPELAGQSMLSSERGALALIGL